MDVAQLACMEGLESWVSRLQFPLSLETLGMRDFPNLEILPSLDNLTSLRYLGIVNWRKLKDLPTALQRLPHLEGLSIGGFWEELDSFLDFQVGSLMHLTMLSLYGWPKHKSLPQQIQHLTSLTDLRVHHFEGVETLPEWLGSLTSLTQLWFQDCKNLTNLPSVQAIQRLTKLHTLYIYRCHPLLKQRCSRDSSTDWPKISHIPFIVVDGQIIQSLDGRWAAPYQTTANVYWKNQISWWVRPQFFRFSVQTTLNGVNFRIEINPSCCGVSQDAQ